MLPVDPHPLINGKLSKLLVILSWDCWVAASFLLALSVDKVSNKREAYSQAGQSGQRSADLRAGLCRGALWGEHRQLECTEKGPFALFLSSIALRAIKTLSLEHQEWRVSRAHSNPLHESVVLTPGYELRFALVPSVVSSGFCERSLAFSILLRLT